MVAILDFQSLAIFNLTVTSGFQRKVSNQLAFQLWRRITKYIFKIASVAAILDILLEGLRYFFYLQCTPILFDNVCGVKAKTAEGSECGDIGFWPGQKSHITHVTNYHTFCAPQERCVLESHVSITYAKCIFQ